MDKVISSDGQDWYFDFRKFYVGEWYEGHTGWHIVTEVTSGEAVDMEGQVDRGWMHRLRRPTEAELTEMERERAAWDALTPQQRTASYIKELSERFPGLDWGDVPVDESGDWLSAFFS